jgi:hypothetical protein
MQHEASHDTSRWPRLLAISGVVGAVALGGLFAASRYIDSLPEQPTISLLPGQTLGDLAAEARELSPLTSVPLPTEESAPKYTDIFLEYCTILGITPEIAATMSVAELYVLEQHLSPERVLQLATLLGGEHHDEGAVIATIGQIATDSTAQTANSPLDTLEHPSHGDSGSNQPNNNQGSAGDTPTVATDHSHDTGVDGVPAASDETVGQVIPGPASDSQGTQSDQSTSHSGDHSKPGTAVDPETADQQQTATTSTVESAPSTIAPPTGYVETPEG